MKKNQNNDNIKILVGKKENLIKFLKNFPFLIQTFSIKKNRIEKNKEVKKKYPAYNWRRKVNLYYRIKEERTM